MPLSGDDIKNASDGVSGLIKVGERNRWAIVLLISFASNVIQFVHSEKKDTLIMQMQQQNAQKAQDALYNIYLTRKELDTVKTHINEKDTK